MRAASSFSAYRVAEHAPGGFLGRGDVSVAPRSPEVVHHLGRLAEGGQARVPASALCRAAIGLPPSLASTSVDGAYTVTRTPDCSGNGRCSLQWRCPTPSPKTCQRPSDHEP